MRPLQSLSMDKHSASSPRVMTSSLLLLFNFTGPARCEICSASRVLGVSVQSESQRGRRFLLWNVRVKTRSSGDLCDVTRGKPGSLSWFVIRPPYISLRRHQSKTRRRSNEAAKLHQFCSKHKAFSEAVSRFCFFLNNLSSKNALSSLNDHF